MYTQVVGIDPGMSDLLFCVDSDLKTQTQFRYTQDTRRKETRQKKYRDILQSMKRTSIVDGLTVNEHEAAMSAYDKKTLDFQRFKVYLEKKNQLNQRLGPFYEQYLLRKLKLGSYSRTQITEARMLKRFEKQFGPPADTVICIGDWDQKQVSSTCCMKSNFNLLYITLHSTESSMSL